MFPRLAYVCRRKNYVQAAYVNAALALHNGNNSERLKSLLRSQGVPEDVIARVLFRGGPARKP